MNKQIPLGSLGTLSLVEAAGKFVATFAVSQQCGGGSLSGFVTIQEQLVVTGNGLQVVDAGFIAAENKWPSLATELAGAKALADAFLATL